MIRSYEKAPAARDADPALPLNRETAFDPHQLQLPGVSNAANDELEWESPVKVLTNYLSAVGVSDPPRAARSLLTEFRSLSDLLGASWWRLRWVAGKRLADIIHASRSLMRAKLLEQVKEGPVVARGSALIDFLQHEIGFLDHERLIALYVDGNCRLMRIETIGDGTVGEVPINVRKVVSSGLFAGATGFLLVHNHPSGIPEPSKADLDVTSRLRDLGKQVELHLLDHLIIARGRFGSIEDFWREAQWLDSDVR